MIVLVLSMHACDTYSPFGNWYYQEHPPVSFATALTFGLYQSFLQAFFMGLLFFISGYFAAGSLERKGRSRFTRDRLVRLGIPTLHYMLLIGPLTQYFLSHTWGQGGFAYQWRTHIADGEILSETGPMWFAAVLLLFSICYAALGTNLPAERRRTEPPSIRNLIVFMGVMALATYAVRIVCPQTTAVFNVHPGDVAQYALMFAAGTLVSRRRWLNELANDALRTASPLLIASLVLLAALLYWGGAWQGDTSRYSGGPGPVSLGKSLWEAMVCVAMTMGLLAVYRRYFGAQNALGRRLSDNAFAVYLLHPPVIIALAMGIHAIVWPALAKAALLTVIAAVASFLLSDFVVRRLPGLRRIL
jgi:glucan biosynthesis protein C